jgi:hypothetical protein
MLSARWQVGLSCREKAGGKRVLLDLAVSDIELCLDIGG